MQFLQPILLWGLLGIGIPILVHLWRGKKGKVIHWAAMRWLSAMESSATKGAKLDNILVLLLRILLFVLLVLSLSQVFVPMLDQASEGRIVHLVQPSNPIVEEYRFEIQQALERGEEVYWIDDDLTRIENVEDLKPVRKQSSLQVSLNKLPRETTELYLYLGNSQNAFKSDFYLSPIRPTLFLGDADLAKSPRQVVSIAGGKAFAVDEEGVLDSIPEGKKETASVDLGEDDFAYFLGEISDQEKVFVKASLDAIKDVYGFGFVEKEKPDGARLIFDSQFPAGDSSDKLYFVAGNFSFSEQANLVSFPDQLDFEHSELVQAGKLPEVILEKFLAQASLEKLDVPLSQTQLESRFLVQDLGDEDKKPNLNLLLLGFLVLCLAAERFLANRQGI